MERLTKLNSDGTGYFYPTCFEKCNGARGNCDKCFFEEKVCNNLGEYEDLEEQGLLLKLPCKVGDTIFVIPSKVNYDLNIVSKHVENNRVYEQKVHSIQMFNCCTYLLSTCEGMCCVRSESYKETWFLSKEEAEKALAELEVKARYLVEIAGEDGYFHEEWDQDTARFVMNGDGLTVDFDNYWAHEVEVVGNIFDNPELLKEGAVE